MQTLKGSVIKLLETVLHNLKNDNSEMSEQEAMDIISAICHQPMSMDSACSYLNLHSSRFRDLVREGKIPKGRKRKGFKELVWYKDEIDECKNKLKLNNNGTAGNKYR